MVIVVRRVMAMRRALVRDERYADMVKSIMEEYEKAGEPGTWHREKELSAKRVAGAAQP